MDGLKLNKTNLNKIIKWSSSRYNNFKKKDVIELIIKGMSSGHLNGYEEYFFHSGSYCENSSMTRLSEYVVDFKAKTIIECWTDEVLQDPGYMITKIINKWQVEK